MNCPDDQFLEADLTCDDARGATIRFRIRDEALGGAADKMKSHFPSDLAYHSIRRSGSIGGGESIESPFRTLGFGSAAAIRDHLREEANGLRRLYGNNYWKAITAEALSGTQTFLDAMAAAE